MKFWTMVFFSFIFSLNVFAFEPSYNVRGVIESGGTVEGTARSGVGDTDVSGELTDANGSYYSYEGDWIGNGHITGETDSGESVDLLIK